MKVIFPGKFLLIIVLILLGTIGQTKLYAQAQHDNLGKEFYVAFGPNLGGDESNNLMALYITSRVPANVKIEVPAIGFTRTLTTVPGSISTVVLPSDTDSKSVEIRSVETVVKGMAVHITSDSEIAVFGMSHKTYSSDAFMALPVDVLGTEYRAMSYPTSSAGGPQSTPGLVWMIAIEDGTNVTITPKARTGTGKAANVPFSIVLNKGEVYLVTGSPFDPSNDITGTLIESDRPLAVFSGHKRTEMPKGATNEQGDISRDHLVEQLPPVSAWGNSAIVVPFATSSGADLVRIISAEDNNTIKVAGTVVATLNSGQMYEIPALNQVTVIEATNPILVGQYLHTSWGALELGRAYGDPALALVFPVEQFTTSYTIVSVEDANSFTGNFVNIVVDASGVASMKIDGNPISGATFSKVPGSNYMYAQLSVEQGTHNITGDKPFGVTVYALGNVDSYAYTGGTLIKTITPLKTTDVIIDFQDRLLKPNLTGAFDTTVYLRNISSDPVGVSAFINRNQDVTKFTVTRPGTPLELAPGAMDSMTIRFEPLEANRRMHTTITAKTEHLRAYVVEVYGRGVLDGPAAYSDSSQRDPIDTVYFGFFAQNDDPFDSIIYLGNDGTAPTDLDSLIIYGDDAEDFSVMGTNFGSKMKLPFTIDTSRKQYARTVIRFKADNVNGWKVARLRIVSKNGMVREIVLIAQVRTIKGLSVGNATFDTIERCKDQTRNITVNNINDVPVRIDSVVIMDTSGSFTLANGMPLTLDPGAQRDLSFRFTGNGNGRKNAIAIVYFNIPTGYTQTVSLTGFVESKGLSFRAAQHVHMKGGDQYEMPIYATTNLNKYGAHSYTITLHYDSVYLEDIDVNVENTLSENFYVSAVDGWIGNRQITLETYPDNTLQGGGDTVLKPLIYIKFKSTRNDEDPYTFSKYCKIDYDITLNGIEISNDCLAREIIPGEVVLDSACATPQVKTGDYVPTETFLEQNMPNPFNPSTVIRYDVGREGWTKVEVLNDLGQTVATLVDAVQKPGHYSTTFNAAGLSSGVYYTRLNVAGTVKTRKMVLSK